MSIAFESPTRRCQNTESYFTPLNVPASILTQQSSSPTLLGHNSNNNSNSHSLSHNNNNNNNSNNDNSTEGSTTPFYTAPINPLIHQEFINAINHRHTSQQTVFTPTLERKPVSFSGASIAERRLAAKQQQQQQQQQPISFNGGSIAERRLAAKQQQQQQQDIISNNSVKPSINGLNPISPSQLADLLSQTHQQEQTEHNVLILDVRSFVQFSHARIKHSINVSIPNTILKRPTFTMEKIYEAVVETDRLQLKQWAQYKSIVFYDQSSTMNQEQCATTYLSNKMLQSGFKGSSYYLQGGYDAFQKSYPGMCILSPPTQSGKGLTGSLPLRNKIVPGMKTPSLRLSSLPINNLPNIGPFTAPMPQFENQAFNPFFSNIRQNMELAHGPIKERFPIRLPSHCHAKLQSDHTLIIEMDKLDPKPRCFAGARMETSQDNKHIFILPRWLQNTMIDTSTGNIGTLVLSVLYEKLEKTEQRRLQNIMHYHSKNTDCTSSDFPLSIVAGIEMGALNRYTNIWPFEYTRVKIHDTPAGSTGYINASFIQYPNNKSLSSNSQDENMSTSTVTPSTTIKSSSLDSFSGDSTISSSISSISSSSVSLSCPAFPNVPKSSSPTATTAGATTNNTTTSSTTATITNNNNNPSTPTSSLPDYIKPESLNLMKSSDWQSQPFRRYISTQGPLPSTFNDFWQVVWEQKSRVVVMLTKEEEMNKIKCHRYWPSELNQMTHYGNTCLTLVKERIHKIGSSEWVDDVVYEREFKIERVSNNNGIVATRYITQLHYTGWMDYGVPDDPIGTLQLIQLADYTQRQYESKETSIYDIGPMIIHCSAGCGRSGAFCVIDTALRQLTHFKNDDGWDVLWDIIYTFREQRLSMVQTLRQFVFCYEVIWWWYLGYGRNYDDNNKGVDEDIEMMDC